MEYIFLDTIESTSSYASENIEKKDNSFCVASLVQTKGRGRIGNSFYSPKGGVYFTLAIKEKIKHVEFLTFYVAVAVFLFIKKHFNIKLGIKWVNDLFYQGKKVAGILCEKQIDAKNRHWYLIGVGINFSSSFENSPLQNIATSLNIEVDATEVVKKLSHEIVLVLNKNIDFIMNLYDENMFIKNQEIIFSQDERLYRGIVQELDKKGNLLVQYDNKIISLNSGEVSLVSSAFIQDK